MGDFTNNSVELTQVATIKTDEKYRVPLDWGGVDVQVLDEIELSPSEAFSALENLLPEDVLNGTFEIGEDEDISTADKDALWAAHVYTVLRAVGLKDFEARELLNSKLIPELRAYRDSSSDKAKIEEDFKYHMWLITNSWELTYPKKFGQADVAEAAILSVGKEGERPIEIYWNPSPRDVIKSLTELDLRRILQGNVNPKLERLALLKWQMAFNELALRLGLVSEISTSDEDEGSTKVDPNFVYFVTDWFNRARQNSGFRSRFVPVLDRIIMSLVGKYKESVIKEFYNEIDVPITLRNEGLGFYNEHLGNLALIIRELTKSEAAIDPKNPLYVRYLVYRRLYGAEGIVDILSNAQVCREKSACAEIDRELNGQLVEVSGNEREGLLKRVDQEVRTLNLKIKLNQAKKALDVYSDDNWLSFARDSLREAIQGEFPSELLKFITSDMQRRVQGNSIPGKIRQVIRRSYTEDGGINENSIVDMLALWSLLQFDLLMSPKLAKLFVKINDWYTGLTEDEQTRILNKAENKKEEFIRILKGDDEFFDVYRY